MQRLEDPDSSKLNASGEIVSLVVRIGVAILIPAIAFYILIQGFLFLRANEADKWVITTVAVLWGVGGVAALYWIFNWLSEQLPTVWTQRLQPFIFIGPAMAILIWFLALPTLRTLYISLFDRNGPTLGVFVGLQNYITAFTEREMLEAFRNNIFYWILIATPLTIVFGLLVAVLADRSKFERLAKSMIFMPMAISFVGAGVIWNFIYEVKPIDAEQIGLLNAIVKAFGGIPRAWTSYAGIAPWNNIFLVVIVVWLQSGFSMVLFSAALKGIPEEILEAARMDGATEIQLFFRIMIPSIMSTIITVSTTVVIFTLKIFDVVWVMTGGQFGTGVIATQFYRQSFTARNAGYGAAIAIVLLIAVIPVMIYNLRQFKNSEAF